MSEEHAHEHPNYVKIYWILIALLVVSVVGPMAEIRVLTMITAFGIAIVKAYLVAKNFMHINLTPKYVSMFVGTALVFMLLFYAGTSVDVYKQQGDNWYKPPVPAQPETSFGEGHTPAPH